MLRKAEYTTKRLMSCGVGVSVTAETSLLEKILADEPILQMIPSPYISEPVKEEPSLYAETADKFSLKGHYPNYKYYGKSAADPLFVADYMLERRREENGIFTLHSSCVEKDGKAIIFIGGNDVGKTNTAINLARDYGYKLVSDHLTSVNEKFEIVGKIEWFKDRKGFVKLKYKLDSDFENFGKICTLSESTPKLAGIVYPQISVFPRFFDYSGSETAYYNLYNEFSGFIRGVFKNINDYSYPLRCIDNKTLGIRRSKFIKKVVDEIPLYKIRESPEKICKTVDSLFF